MSVQEQIEILVKLQSIDSDIKQIDQMLGSVDSKIAALDMELHDFESVVEERAADVDNFKKKYRDLESDLNINMPKISKSKDRLSSVKTNKEYQSLLKEIEDLKAINSNIEDQMLECLEQIDQAEQSLVDKDNEFDAVKSRVTEEKRRIEEASAEGRERLKALQMEWQAVFETVEPEFMKAFKNVRERLGNLTIVKVTNAVCEGCNMNIPPQMYNELLRFERLMYCPHCQRIVYSKNS